MTKKKTSLGFTRRRFVQATAVGMVAAATPLRFALGASKLKVGVLLPFSGHLAVVGQSSRKGMDLARRMLGENLELAYFDTESKAEAGRVGAEKMIRDGASILIGAWDSGATISAAQAADAAKVPLVVNVASAPQITEQGFQWVFRNFTPGNILVGGAIQRIKELGELTGVHPKTAVFMHVNDTFGQAVRQGVEILWEKMNVPIEILETIPYDPRARDLSVEVAKARSHEPDVLLPATRVQDAILLVREMVKQDFNPLGIIGPGNPGPYEKAFTDALGKYSNYYMDCVPWYDPTLEMTQEVLAEFKNDYPDERFELNSGFGFEAVQVVADAYARAGAADPAALREALVATKIEDHIMFGGPIEFDEKGQNPNIEVPMLQNQNQEPVVVAPEAAAVAEPVFPVPKWGER